MNNNLSTEFWQSDIVSDFGQAEYILDLCSKTLQNSTKTIVEAGANLPQQGSNSSSFIKNGYTCHLIEGVKEWAECWKSLNLDNTIIHNEFIPYTSNGLEYLLKKIGVPRHFDVLFLDIDGGEYHLLAGLTDYRPSYICIEVDNGFPINIEYVPPQITHGMDGGQASALSTFKLLLKLRYTYIDSFGQDMVFVKNELVEHVRKALRSGYKIGFEGYCERAILGIYHPLVVLLNQRDDDAASGLLMFKKKIDVLIANSQLNDASILYHNLLPWLVALPKLTETKSESYRKDLLSEVAHFRSSYSQILNAIFINR